MAPAGANWAKSIADLRALSELELIRQHDELLTQSRSGVVIGVEYYLEELARRRAEGQARMMIRLTWCIAGLTLANAVLVAVSIL